MRRADVRELRTCPMAGAARKAGERGVAHGCARRCDKNEREQYERKGQSGHAPPGFPSGKAGSHARNEVRSLGSAAK